MIKKVHLLLIFILFILLVPNRVFAATCDYAEQNRLNALGANVKTDYSVEVRKVIENVSNDEDGNFDVEFEYNYFNVNIYNITSELRVVVKNIMTEVESFYFYSDAKDGIITFSSYDLENTLEFQIQIYSTNTANCNDVLVGTKTIRLPRSNRFSEYNACKDAEGFYLCQEFLNNDFDINEAEFFNRLEQYKKSVKEQEENDTNNNQISFWAKTFDFIGKYWYYFASGVIVIGTIVGMIAATKIRRRDI